MKTVQFHINLESSSRALQLQIPVGIFQVFRLGRRIIQLGLALLAIQLGTVVVHKYLRESAIREQGALYSSLESTDTRLDSLEKRIHTSFHQEDLLYLKFGAPIPEMEVRQLGYGGDIPADSILLHDIHPMRGLKHQVLEKMEHVGRQISRSDSSFDIIYSHMEQQYNQWRHIPSVSPCNGRFSSPFGLRTHPVTGETNKMHMGIDISNNRWSPIYASADGIVDLVRNSEFFGNYVVVNHNNGYVSKYGHMEKPIVKPGQFVKRYQILGYMGRTGRTTGIHVHYEVHFNDTPQNPINYILPADYSVE